MVALREFISDTFYHMVLLARVKLAKKAGHSMWPKFLVKLMVLVKLLSLDGKCVGEEARFGMMVSYTLRVLVVLFAVYC